MSTEVGVARTAIDLSAGTTAWPLEAVDAIQRLMIELARLRQENAQLRTALESRIVIEQAKGVLAERYSTVPEVAFEALRRGARSTSRKLHDVARDVVQSKRTPPAVATELTRGVR